MSETQRPTIPPPSEAEPPTRAFYDRLSQRYDAVAEAWEHASRQQGIEALDVKQGEEVLEIGFGTGHGLQQLAKVGARVTGIELSDGMRSVAQQRLAAAGLDRYVHLDVGDARTLPYPDGRFDVCFMCFTAETFGPDDVPKVFAEASRVMRSGGRFGIVSMAETDPPALMEKVYSWLYEHFPHLADCRPIDSVGELCAAGFRIRETTGMSIWRLPIVSVVAMKPDSAWY